MWKWINERDFWLKQPSTEEQFDQLLHVLCGHLLKEELPLWDAFKHVRTARNTFVHEGSARIGKDLVTEQSAGQLIAKATEIIKKIRLWLPAELRWPEPKVPVDVKISHSVPALILPKGGQAPAAEVKSHEAEADASVDKAGKLRGNLRCKTRYVSVGLGKVSVREFVSKSADSLADSGLQYGLQNLHPVQIRAAPPISLTNPQLLIVGHPEK